MIDIKILLPELRKLVIELTEDLLTRVTNDSAIDTGLREAYAQIEKGGRTGDPYEVWLEDYLDQVAVAWVLSCVFVRFMEDNDLIAECWLSGDGDRRKQAEETHELYFRQHPRHSDRDYFEYIFREAGKIPACRDLFAEGKTPLWAVGPSGDAAMKLRAFWREINSDSGQLKRTFNVEAGDTRFLGDLYQDLSEKARKKYALLQTPVFVEEFILDRTLDPAIAEFGLKDVRMIDPTCGSGHFLLGGFSRLFRLWSKPENTTGNVDKDAQNALDGVWGCDINPFAIAIARFRLIVTALQASQNKLLVDAPGWKIHLATGDSLLFGKRWDTSGQVKSEQKFFETEDEGNWAPDIYACEDRDAITEVLGQQYHVVVGNPPYIIVRDRSLNQAYRNRYSTCSGKYSLAVPFIERFFDLSLNQGGSKSGFVGKITANSFMKREFGKKLIEDFFGNIDLTHVIDTSGAYIPGHGTPTVILFGRNRKPVEETVRAVLGIKGEPSTPDDPAQGLVWQSIVQHVDHMEAQDEFTSTTNAPRAMFTSHPWSIGGGGAAELKERLDSESKLSLRNLIDSIGFMVITGCDDVLVAPKRVFERNSLPHRDFVTGEQLRDWHKSRDEAVLFIYDASTPNLSAIPEKTNPSMDKFLWPNRVVLRNRSMFGKTPEQHGLKWYEFIQFIRSRVSSKRFIAYTVVASHNQFVMGSAGEIYNPHAPVISLPADADEDTHLALLGLLNSSAVCFWMKQVSQQKQLTGGDGVRVSTRAVVPYEFIGAQLQKLPIPKAFTEGSLRKHILGAAKRIDELVREMSELTGAAAIERGLKGTAEEISKIFSGFLARRSEIRAETVFLQEEIDFIVYSMFGLVEEPSLIGVEWRWAGVTLDAGQRPFEIIQQRNVDSFTVPSDVPVDWPDVLQKLWRRRIDAIQKSPMLRLIEDDHYKRRWRGRQGLFNHTENQDELKTASRNWLLNRLENSRFWEAEKHETRLQSVSKLADKAGSDENFMRVAAIYRGREDFNLSALISDLVESESVPLLPILRYKQAGLRKRDVWERTWDLQRKEDAGEVVAEIVVPPKYSSADFQKSEHWRLRGTLDVPKERWISFPHCETDGDPSLVIGWAGWNYLQKGTAIVAYYDSRKNEGWTAERLKPLLAALDQLLPWIHQWHPEIDPEYNESAGTSFQTLLDAETQELGLTIDDIRNWTPPAKTKAVKQSAPKQPRQSRKRTAGTEAKE
jgi:hypothetical protein